MNSDGDAYLATIKVDVLFLDLTSVKATRNDSHWRQKCTTFIGFVIALASTASASTENFHSIINAEQQGTSNTLTSEQKHSRSQFFFSLIFYCFFLSFFVCCYVLFALWFLESTQNVWQISKWQSACLWISIWNIHRIYLSIVYNMIFRFGCYFVIRFDYNILRVYSKQTHTYTRFGTNVVFAKITNNPRCSQ